MIQKANKIYKPVYFTDARIIDLWGGRGRGGSHFVTDYFLHLITKPQYFRGYFMRETFSQIKESLYRDFKDRVSENESIQESDFVFNDSNYSILYKPTGNIIISKGFKKSSGKQTAKLKSIAGATHVIIEECEEISEDEFNKLQDSVRTTKGSIQIIRVWNPPHKDHWLIKNYFNATPHPEYEGYYIVEPKGIDNHLSIFSTYLNNIKNINKSTIDVWEGYKFTNIEHYLSDIKGLVSGGVKGQIYKKWNVYSELPEYNYYKIYGLDFGYTNDPMALIELNINKDTKEVYCKEHLYRTFVRTVELINIMKDLQITDEIICDNTNPSDLIEIQLAGFNNAFKTTKGGKEGDKYQRINQLLGYTFYYHKDSVNLQFEGNNYKWAINPETKEPMNKPEDKNDHLMDAKLYSLGYYHRNYGIYDLNKN